MWGWYRFSCANLTFLCLFYHCIVFFVIFVAHKFIYVSREGSFIPLGVKELSEACVSVRN